MKKISSAFFFGAFFVLHCLPLSDQSDLVIDYLLEEENAGFGNTVYIVFTAVEEISADASLQEAVKHLEDKHWKMQPRDTDDPIRKSR